jgi:hypothetical protein
MLLGDEVCAPELLGLVLLAPDWPAAPLEVVSWANDKLPARHTVAIKIKLFFMETSLRDFSTFCINLDRRIPQRYPVLSLTYQRPSRTGADPEDEAVAWVNCRNNLPLDE